MSKASLLEEEGRSANFNFNGERRVPIPILADLLTNSRHGVDVTASGIGVVVRANSFTSVHQLASGPGTSMWELFIGRSVQKGLHQSADSVDVSPYPTFSPTPARIDVSRAKSMSFSRQLPSEERMHRVGRESHANHFNDRLRS